MSLKKKKLSLFNSLHTSCLESMDNTILLRLCDLCVLEFYIIFPSLAKIIAAWRSGSSPLVSLLGSQAAGRTAAL